MEILPTLDLYNFTEPIAAESQYILTSPRSLEACARFGIKPVELLPKTSEELEEELGDSNETNVATAYKKFEKERLRKLRLCRQERERIIAESEPVPGQADGEEDELEEEEEDSLHTEDEGETDEEGNNNNHSNHNNHNNNNHSHNNVKANGDNEIRDSTGVEDTGPSDGEYSLRREKPSILDFLDSTTTYSARMAWQDNTQRKCGSSFFRTSGALASRSGATKEDEKKGRGNDPCTTSTNHTATTNNYNSSSRLSDSSDAEKKKQNKIRRSQSFKLKGEVADSHDQVEKKSRDIERKAKGLAKDVLENPTLISKEDKKILDQYLLRISTDNQDGEQLETEEESASNKKGRNSKLQKSNSCSSADRKKRETSTSKENSDTDEATKWKTKFKKHVQKQEQRGRYFGQEIDSNSGIAGRAPRRPIRSPSLRRNNIAHEDTTIDQLSSRELQLNDIREKHKRAGQEFQEMMKLKLQQREFNKMRQQERKEFQERQLQAMENDLKLWQEELKSYQNMCSERASRMVEKKNAITSLKTQEKRLQKEMEHAVMKSKVEEEERQRQQELKMLVNIKDARSRMIINAKAEYANAGRDCAQLTRSIRSRMQDKEILSSFDKLASRGERMARLERMNSVGNNDSNNSTPTVRTQRKNQSAIHLG